MRKLRREELQVIRKGVQQGIEEIERGKGRTYEGADGLRQLFREVRAQALRELSAERHKKMQ